LNTKVSVIVPIYNTEEYLFECIDSILNQSLTEIEIVCINDGSKDNSGDIISELKAKDKRIKYFEQTNQGLSAARNKGILESNSKYIMFVDSDDCISKNCAKYSYETAEKNGADIVLFNSSRDILDESCNQLIELESNNKIEIFKSVLSFEIQTSTCFAIIKRELIIDNKIFFPLGRLYEDASTLYKFVHLSQRPIKIKNILYFYRKRADSITNSINTKTIDDIFYSLNEVIEYLKLNHLIEYKILVNGRLCALINGIIQNIAKTSNNEELLYYLISCLVNYENKNTIPIEIKMSWLIYLLNIPNFTKSQIFDNLLFKNIEAKYFYQLKYFSFNFAKIFESQKKLLLKNKFYFYGKNSITDTHLKSDQVFENFKGFISSKFATKLSCNQNTYLLSSVDFNDEFLIIINSISSAFIINEKIQNHKGFLKNKHSIYTFYDLLILSL
jgi:glycosyltransferase involved in cell wall biosynthesis